MILTDPDKQLRAINFSLTLPSFSLYLNQQTHLFTLAMLFYVVLQESSQMKLITLLLFLCFALTLAGRNKIEGIGKDVEAAGDAIENSASENKNY